MFKPLIFAHRRLSQALGAEAVGDFLVRTIPPQIPISADERRAAGPQPKRFGFCAKANGVSSPVGTRSTASDLLRARDGGDHGRHGSRPYQVTAANIAPASCSAGRSTALDFARERAVETLGRAASSGTSCTPNPKRHFTAHSKSCAPGTAVVECPRFRVSAFGRNGSCWSESAC